ncbi:WbqC family protein [Flavobacterium sp. JLP]|uniref:WbqC family protein n=1 Tax=unclassified Flavobacterium TaxID=196869 RepID=UPI00049311BA|nr:MULTISPECIES: WbqC family protein [unclassified Flavobacterium]MBF4507150.1 WbqC family protein [Flavobacterium sp. JLP]
MKLAVMQPYFFPYIGYFQLINAVDVFVIYDDVNFIKKGWINRNNILVNGEQFLFNIELKGASQNKLINQIETNYNSQCKEDLLKTIRFAYAKAPFFKDTFSLVKRIIEHKEINISKLITYSLKEICTFLSIETQIIISSDIIKNNNLKGQLKIIEICKNLEANTYINPIGGLNLYDSEAFLQNNISLKFIKSSPIIYNQFSNTFIPHLSIIDVLMFNSPERIKDFLNEYEFI